MPSRIESIAASKPFQILVGPEKKLFTMHSELLARQSKVLNVLVNGAMKEAADAVVEWPDYDPDTFVRFWQFAYTGNYDDPKPTPVENAEPAPAPETADGPSLESAVEEQQSPATVTDVFGYPLRKKSKKMKKPKAATPPIESSPLMDHSKVFLSHAHVYVLADCYDIPDLMVLSIQKLDKLLDGFMSSSPSDKNRDQQAAEDVAAVLEYCYGHGQTIGQGHVKNELKTLLVGHAADSIQQLWDCTAFQEALEEFGEMGRDIIGELVKKLPGYPRPTVRQQIYDMRF